MLRHEPRSRGVVHGVHHHDRPALRWSLGQRVLGQRVPEVQPGEESHQQPGGLHEGGRDHFQRAEVPKVPLNLNSHEVLGVRDGTIEEEGRCFGLQAKGSGGYETAQGVAHEAYVLFLPPAPKLALWILDDVVPCTKGVEGVVPAPALLLVARVPSRAMVPEVRQEHREACRPKQKGCELHPHVIDGAPHAVLNDYRRPPIQRSVRRQPPAGEVHNLLASIAPATGEGHGGVFALRIVRPEGVHHVALAALGVTVCVSIWQPLAGWPPLIVRHIVWRHDLASLGIHLVSRREGQGREAFVPQEAESSYNGQVKKRGQTQEAETTAAAAARSSAASSGPVTAALADLALAGLHHKAH
mmetsp:Transcript_104751/g.296034  ORF Transcript_104751/g.296034 Transcript_104751/m.296034 type:complete len:356 (+) Transcript_104751:368-1435(+)